MVELLFTIVLVAVALAAVFPFIVSALLRTSEDLNTPPSPADAFGDGRLGTEYAVAGETRPYHTEYVVEPADEPEALQKSISVSVRRAGSDFVTSADTIIDNPPRLQLPRSPGPRPRPDRISRSQPTVYYFMCDNNGIYPQTCEWGSTGRFYGLMVIMESIIKITGGDGVMPSVQGAIFAGCPYDAAGRTPSKRMSRSRTVRASLTTRRSLMPLRCRRC